MTARWSIHKRAQGFQSFTEYAFQQGRAPLSRELLFRRLARHLEVVVSSPPLADYDELIEMLL